MKNFHAKWVDDLRFYFASTVIIAFMFYCALFGEFYIKFLKSHYGSGGTLGVIGLVILCVYVFYLVFIPNRKIK